MLGNSCIAKNMFLFNFTEHIVHDSVFKLFKLLKILSYCKKIIAKLIEDVKGRESVKKNLQSNN